MALLDNMICAEVVIIPGLESFTRRKNFVEWEQSRPNGFEIMTHYNESRSIVPFYTYSFMHTLSLFRMNICITRTTCEIVEPFREHWTWCDRFRGYWRAFAYHSLLIRFYTILFILRFIQDIVRNVNDIPSH